MWRGGIIDIIVVPRGQEYEPLGVVSDDTLLPKTRELPRVRVVDDIPRG